MLLTFEQVEAQISSMASWCDLMKELQTLNREVLGLITTGVAKFVLQQDTLTSRVLVNILD